MTKILHWYVSFFPCRLRASYLYYLPNPPHLLSANFIASNKPSPVPLINWRHRSKFSRTDSKKGRRLTPSGVLNQHPKLTIEASLSIGTTNAISSAWLVVSRQCLLS